MEHLLLDEEAIVTEEDRRNPPGIVISGRFTELRPAVSAFIWGGKIRPVPELPYGRQSA